MGDGSTDESGQMGPGGIGWVGWLDGMPCAICGGEPEAPLAQRHLTHGVSVWLCDQHASDAFARRDGGVEFVERLARVWAAAGALSARRMAALRAHVQRVRHAGVQRGRPGSYSWPLLRQEAERRFAAGQPPGTVITELRKSYADGPAMVPSIRTMRRWFTQARWLAPARQTRPRSDRPQWRSSLLRPGVGLMPRGMMQNPVWPFIHPWKDPP